MVPKSLMAASESVKNVVGTATYLPTKTHLVVWSRFLRDEPEAIDGEYISVKRLKDYEFGGWKDFLLTSIYRYRTYMIE